MLGSIPQQKFRFYHLPTRGRAKIKLGDAWYVSNVSIIFDCSMLLYYHSWMFYNHFIVILYHFLEQTQSRRLGVDVKKQPRWPRGWLARPVRVGAPSCLVAASLRLWLPLQVFWFAFGPRKIIAKVSFRLDSVWYSFSAKHWNKGKNRNWHWALG